ncbi:metal ABC transporter permease [Luteolibacter pohnpeiensis]|uniref:Metal ABC transporter permease n=1 Tax=Luteolibacter pohnpeiensis TaxID=454153 RepID=A0A934VWC6_9BACT|nr:metal ABC transporter permease [Luteolibacter pohnpeiensis]MBK1883145.1 metal ABC transporter permease [Luteolibacter pohnpeiensis]
MSGWLDFLEFEFMRDAMLVGSMVAAMCAALSCFLVLKGWSLMGDAISHAVLPGIVLAYLTGLPLLIGAFAAGLFCSSSIGWIKRHSRIKEDTVMGVAFTGMFAFGLVLFSRTPSEMHLDHILVGNILGITRSQFLQTLSLGGAILTVTLMLRRDLLLVCFDPGQARAMALADRFLNYLLLSMLSLAIVVSLQAVGIILVVAMLVAPGCIGHLWCDRLDRMLIVAITSAVLSTWIGLMVSFQIDAASGACIVLVQAMFFFLSLLFAPKHGIFFRTT